MLYLVPTSYSRRCILPTTFADDVVLNDEKEKFITNYNYRGKQYGLKINRTKRVCRNLNENENQIYHTQIGDQEIPV